MQTLYILDASSFLYRSYFAIRNVTNAKGESTNALFGFIRSILKLFKDFSPEHLAVVFDGPQNIKKRKELYAEYKAHRTEMPADLRYQIDWAREFCGLMGLAMLSVPEVEADDTMGSIAKWAEKQGSKVFLCSSDKDLCQLVNEHVHMLNTHKDNLILDPAGVEATHGVPPSQIIDLLSITGDTSDNIPGLPGFGPKTAAALLQEFGSLEEILEHPEKVPGKKKQETIVEHADKARLSKQLVTIDTSVDFPKDVSFFERKKPRLEPLKEFYGKMNFSSLLRELESGPASIDEKTVYTLVDDEASFKELLEQLSKQKEICFDTETTHVHPIKAELVGIGFCYKQGEAWYVPVNGKLGLKAVLEGVKSLFENSGIGFYGHNVKYDLHVMNNYDIKIPNISFDTIIASYVLNSHNRQHSLDHLSLEYFGKVKIATSELIGKGKNEITMREVPIEKVSEYCCEDVDYTYRLKQLLSAQLEERKMKPLFYDIELPLLRVLARMERHGIFLDIPRLEAMAVDIKQEILLTQEAIFQMADQEFNLNSPKQMSEILFGKLQIPPPKKTATGYSTNADVLTELKHEYPIVEKILEYRSLEKLRSTYLDTLPHEVYSKTHRIHSTFNQSVAATGRLSSQDPNLQNIPVRTPAGRKIREAFRPEKEGWSFLSADYSQIELRLLAHLCEDPSLIQAFQHGEDIHAHTAAAVMGIPLDQVTSEQRYRAKAVNFGIIYGQQAFGLSRELNIDVKEAEAFIKRYFERYPKVQAFLESCKEKARMTGKATTMTGRERAIPEIDNKNKQIRSFAERLAVNTPLQGTAADLIKLAMLDVDEQLQKEQKIGFLILQIHDELVFEIPDFEIVAIETLVRKCMEGIFKLKVPLKVNISIGKNWGEC